VLKSILSFWERLRDSFIVKFGIYLSVIMGYRWGRTTERKHHGILSWIAWPSAVGGTSMWFFEVKVVLLNLSLISYIFFISPLWSCLLKFGKRLSKYKGTFCGWGGVLKYKKYCLG
jgi:hypothetical protein